MAARKPAWLWGTSTGSIRTLPKRPASIHLDRALAQSTLTTPKCWGPTRATRGCRAPAGLWTSCRRRPRRRRDRAETVMGWTSARGLAEQPRFSRGSQEMAPERFLSQIGHIPGRCQHLLRSRRLQFDTVALLLQAASAAQK